MTNIPPEIKPYKREVWKPITIDGDGALTASKFAGKPWLGKDEEWPKCPHCQNPLEFFVQLNLNQLPESLQNKFGSGILQMFYCTYTNIYGEEVCEIDYEGWEAFSDIHFLRIIQPEGEVQDVEIPEIEYITQPKIIVGWQQLDDYPNFEEAQEIGIELSFDEYYSSLEKYPIEGDKLVGWPFWEQNIEYPNCPICAERMELVFQLYSDGNSPFIGCRTAHGHITQCQNHKDQLAFCWSSF